MKPGTRVVSHSFNMGDWEPDSSGFTGSSDQLQGALLGLLLGGAGARVWHLADSGRHAAARAEIPDLHRHVHDRRQGAQDRGRPRARRGDHLHRRWREVRGHDEGEDADGEAEVGARSDVLSPPSS